jgi:hypothetical protein
VPAVLREAERAIGDMTSLLHEVSNVATRQTNVYRANGRAEDLSGQRAQWDGEQKALPAMLRSREGRVALPATPMMVNLAARELLADAYDTLLTWASHLGADPISSAHVVPWLLTHANEIRFTEDAAQIHDEITYLHRRMVTAVDRSPSKVYAGPCHADIEGSRCQSPLYAWPGADEITCEGVAEGPEINAGCGTVHTTAERQDWLISELESTLVSVDDLLAALPHLMPDLAIPRRGNISGWIRQGRLVAHGRNHVGEDTFSGKDLLKLIKEHKPHRYAPRPSRRSA